MADQVSPWVRHLWNTDIAFEPSQDAETDVVRTNAAEQLVANLDVSGADRYLATAEARRDWFTNLSVEQFTNLVVQVNGTLRGLPPEARMFSAHDISVGNWVAPDRTDRQALFERTFKVAQAVAADRSVPADEALANAAVVFVGGLTYVHPFMNGNGRTGRVTSFLIANGYDGSDAARTAVSSLVASAGRETWATNPRQIDDSLFAALDHGPARGGAPPLDREHNFSYEWARTDGWGANPDDPPEYWRLLQDAADAMSWTSTGNIALRDVLHRHGMLDPSLVAVGRSNPFTAHVPGEPESLEAQSFLDVRSAFQKAATLPMAERETVLRDLVTTERSYRAAAVHAYLDTMSDLFLGREAQLPTIADRAQGYVTDFRASREVMTRVAVPATDLGNAARMVMGRDVAAMVSATPPDPAAPLPAIENGERRQPAWWPAHVPWTPVEVPFAMARPLVQTIRGGLVPGPVPERPEPPAPAPIVAQTMPFDPTGWDFYARSAAAAAASATPPPAGFVPQVRNAFRAAIGLPDRRDVGHGGAAPPHPEAVTPHVAATLRRLAEVDSRAAREAGIPAAPGRDGVGSARGESAQQRALPPVPGFNKSPNAPPRPQHGGLSL